MNNNDTSQTSLIEQAASIKNEAGSLFFKMTINQSKIDASNLESFREQYNDSQKKDMESINQQFIAFNDSMAAYLNQENLTMSFDPIAGLQLQRVSEGQVSTLDYQQVKPYKDLMGAVAAMTLTVGEQARDVDGLYDSAINNLNPSISRQIVKEGIGRLYTDFSMTEKIKNNLAHVEKIDISENMTTILNYMQELAQSKKADGSTPSTISIEAEKCLKDFLEYTPEQKQNIAELENAFLDKQASGEGIYSPKEIKSLEQRVQKLSQEIKQQEKPLDNQENQKVSLSFLQMIWKFLKSLVFKDIEHQAPDLAKNLNDLQEKKIFLQGLKQELDAQRELQQAIAQHQNVSKNPLPTPQEAQDMVRSNRSEYLERTFNSLTNEKNREEKRKQGQQGQQKRKLLRVSWEADPEKLFSVESKSFEDIKAAKQHQKEHKSRD